MFTIYPMGPCLGLQILIPNLAATTHQLSLSVCDWAEKRDCESWHSQHSLATRPSYWPIFTFSCDYNYRRGHKLSFVLTCQSPVRHTIRGWESMRRRGIRFVSVLHRFKSYSVRRATFSHRKETLPLSSRQPDCSRLSKQLWGPSVELNLQMSVARIHWHRIDLATYSWGKKRVVPLFFSVCNSLDNKWLNCQCIRLSSERIRLILNELLRVLFTCQK